MFALGLWDSRKERGYLIRDRFGIKPLYVAEHEGKVLFASEIRALLATGCVPRHLSDDAVASYLSTGSIAEPLTIIDGITAVPPGCLVEVVRSGKNFVMASPERFVQTFDPADAGERHPRSHVHRIRNALRESVAYHLVSDVPVAVFLSGGIDSSAVAGLASEVSSTPIESFTVTFEEADFSEAGPAREAALRYGTNHHEILLSGNDLFDALPDVFTAMDQPSLDGLNTFVVSRAVRAFGLKVVLSGLGGDELFGGYPSFHRARYLAPTWKLPSMMRKLGSMSANTFEDNRLARISSVLTDESASRAAYSASRSLFSGRRISRLMGIDSRKSTPVAPSVDGIDFASLSLMQQVSLFELSGYMRNTLLRDSDVFSMAHALELRVPMIDSEVANVAHEAAAVLKPTAGRVKPLLVEAVRDLLTPETISNPKRGFTLPFETWMRHELYTEVNSILEGDSASAVALNGDEVSKVWQSFKSRKPGVNWSRPWALYTLMRWARQNGITPVDAKSRLALVV
jgi:asparagine synthase (glutamine-hydrolysing)